MLLGILYVGTTAVGEKIHESEVIALLIMWDNKNSMKKISNIWIRGKPHDHFLIRRRRTHLIGVNAIDRKMMRRNLPHGCITKKTGCHLPYVMYDLVRTSGVQLSILSKQQLTNTMRAIRYECRCLLSIAADLLPGFIVVVVVMACAFSAIFCGFPPAALCRFNYTLYSLSKSLWGLFGHLSTPSLLGALRR